MKESPELLVALKWAEHVSLEPVGLMHLSVMVRELRLRMLEKAPGEVRGEVLELKVDQGMVSLRDWLAVSATDEDCREYRQRLKQRADGRAFLMTREQAKYAYADAMLAARDGGAA